MGLGRPEPHLIPGTQQAARSNIEALGIKGTIVGAQKATKTRGSSWFLG